MENIWSASATQCTNGSKLFEKFDIHAYYRYQKRYSELSNEEKRKYKGAEAYIAQESGFSLSPLNSNYKKVYEEVSERIEKGTPHEVLVIDTVFQSDLIQNLLISLENEKYIQDLYKSKKLRVTGGINNSEAIRLMECIKQGRSLLQAGQKADIIAKPLIDFYAASAYAYAIIVINSPLHKSIDSLKGSHGHTYNHQNQTIDFGGNIPSGTFLDLMAAIPVIHLESQNIDLQYSLLDSIEFMQEHSIKLSLGALLSMIPELRDAYARVDTQHKITHRLSIDTKIENKAITYNFYIGDGIDKPDRGKIEKSFKSNNIIENQGSYKVSIADKDLNQIMPMIYKDVKGELWYIESPIDGLVIPEFCLHFLVISALCNIMRYSPHEWSTIITNKISPQYSLLISEYIHLFELKFPMLVTQLITNYLPHLK